MRSISVFKCRLELSGKRVLTFSRMATLMGGSSAEELYGSKTRCTNSAQGVVSCVAPRLQVNCSEKIPYCPRHIFRQLCSLPASRYEPVRRPWVTDKMTSTIIFLKLFSLEIPVLGSLTFCRGLLATSSVWNQNPQSALSLQQGASR